MSSPTPNGDGWWTQVGYIVGAGGLGAAALELIRRWFGRADRADDDAIAFRAELRKEISELNTRNDTLTAQREAEMAVSHSLRDQLSASTAEAIALRNRYHRFRNYLTEVVLLYDEYAERLHIPPHERMRIPSWIDEEIDGPTKRLAIPQPHAREMP